MLGPQEPTLPPPPSLTSQPAARPAFLPPHISLNCPLSSTPLPSLTWTTAMALSPPVTDATLTSWAHTSTPLPYLQRLTPRDGPPSGWALNSIPGFHLSSWLPVALSHPGTPCHLSPRLPRRASALSDHTLPASWIPRHPSQLSRHPLPSR